MDTAHVTAGNLPAELDSFIGRRREVSQARRLLSRSRLVTLTGVGGVGKTRLARRVAAGQQQAFADGVWLVDLTGLDTPKLLAREVAETLRIQDYSARDPLTILTDHLRDKHVLLLLDNCEHMLTECAELVAGLLAAAPELHVLATSRQPLQLPMELVMAVPPLSLPASGKPISPQALEQFSSVVLFVERALAVQPDFQLTTHNSAAVADICRRLDGLPLAIELAAVQLRTMPPEQLAQRLASPQLLSAQRRDSRPHHRSLQALIDWSFDMCTSAERLLWARASVFAGSFDVASAQAVCSGGTIAAGEVPGLVASLTEKSILIPEEMLQVASGMDREDGPHVDAEPAPRDRQDGERYRLLGTLRQYGRSRLSELDDDNALRSRHLAHFSEVAAQTRRMSFAAQQVSWFRRLQQEHTDLRAALEFAITRSDRWQTGLRMAADLLYHWINNYYLGEGRRWLDGFLSLDVEPTEARVDALWASGWLAIIQGDVAAAHSTLAEARSLAQRLRMPTALGYVAMFSGMAAMLTGDTAAALELYNEALARHRAAGNQHGVALGLIRSSMAYSYAGDTERAIAFGEECLAVCDAVGDTWHKSYALTALGIEAWRQGDTGRATRFEQESLRLNQELDDRLGMVLNLEVLVLAAAADRDYERASRLLGVLQTQQGLAGTSMPGYTHLADYIDHTLREIRGALGEQRFKANVRKGTSLSLPQSLALALQDKRQAGRTQPAGGTPRLTRREQEIAELVAEGLSNKEIAERLVIAQRTAEGHVQNILVKLGFTARGQIAAWVAEQRRTSDEH